MAERYEAMGKPERRGRISTSHGIGQIISAYKIFNSFAGSLKSVKERAAHPQIAHFDLPSEDLDLLYSEAYRLVEPHILLSDYDKAVGYLKANSNTLTGLFISAMINAMPADEFAIAEFQELGHIGYRLKEGKRLILGQDVEAGSAGMYGRGSLISFGITDKIGEKASGGFYANHGESGCLGFENSGGTFVNFSDSAFMSDATYGGAAINLGSISHVLSRFSMGGINVNYGTTRAFANFCSNAINLNLGCVKQKQTGLNRAYYRNMIRAVDKESYPQEISLDNQMKELARRLERLKCNQPEPEEWNRCNYAAFEKEVMNVANDLETFVRKNF